MSSSYVKVDYQRESPRFSVDNLDELQEGVEYLNKYGYAVFSNILSEDEVSANIDLFWKFLENMKGRVAIKRDDPTTWKSNW